MRLLQRFATLTDAGHHFHPVNTGRIVLRLIQFAQEEGQQDFALFQVLAAHPDVNGFFVFNFDQVSERLHVFPFQPHLVFPDVIAVCSGDVAVHAHNEARKQSGRQKAVAHLQAQVIGRSAPVRVAVLFFGQQRGGDAVVSMLILVLQVVVELEAPHEFVQFVEILLEMVALMDILPIRLPDSFHVLLVETPEARLDLLVVQNAIDAFYGPVVVDDDMLFQFPLMGVIQAGADGAEVLQAGFRLGIYFGAAADGFQFRFGNDVAPSHAFQNAAHLLPVGRHGGVDVLQFLYRRGQLLPDDAQLSLQSFFVLCGGILLFRIPAEQVAVVFLFDKRLHFLHPFAPEIAFFGIVQVVDDDDRAAAAVQVGCFAPEVPVVGIVTVFGH